MFERDSSGGGSKGEGIWLSQWFSETSRTYVVTYHFRRNTPCSVFPLRTWWKLPNLLMSNLLPFLQLSLNLFRPCLVLRSVSRSYGTWHALLTLHWFQPFLDFLTLTDYSPEYHLRHLRKASSCVPCVPPTPVGVKIEIHLDWSNHFTDVPFTTFY